MNRSRYAGHPWLTPPPAQRGRLLLLALPYAGMGASVFREWGDRLPAAVEVRGVRLPGRESRFGEPALSTMEELIPRLAAGVEPAVDRPWVAYGHSMGAIVAFELARAMTAVGRPPDALFVGAFRAPQLPDRYPPLHQLPVDEFRDQLRRRYGLLNEALDHPEILEALEPTLRADSKVCDTYELRPGPALSCPLVVFGGTGDTHIEQREYRPWREHTTAPFAVESIEGDHFFMTSARDRLLDRLRSHLEPLLTS